METENISLLRDGLKRLELELDDDRLERLVAYHDYVLEQNRDMNLIGFKSERESVIKNLINGLSPWRQFHPTKHTCDIGSGGGFPAIPLAIALNMDDVTLVESKAKKAHFLAEACERFAPHVKVLNVNAGELKDRFRQLIFCAFGSLNKIARLGELLLYSEGRIIAYKGRRETIDHEITECKSRHKAWTVVPFTVPFLEEGAQRHLCIYHARV